METGMETGTVYMPTTERKFSRKLRGTLRMLASESPLTGSSCNSRVITQRGENERF